MPSFAEIKDMLSARRVGGGRGFVNPPTVGEMAKAKALDEAMGDASERTKDEIRNAIRERGVERESERAYNRVMPTPENKKSGGKIKGYAKGGMTASKRADGIAQRGKTRGTMVACGGGYMKGKK